MDKEALRAEIKRLGLMDVNTKHELWRKAFEMHNAANPGNKVSFSLCGSCFSRVRNWLRQ